MNVTATTGTKNKRNENNKKKRGEREGKKSQQHNIVTDFETKKNIDSYSMAVCLSVCLPELSLKGRSAKESKCNADR